ncbi:MAG: hypothetical protein PHI99_05100 [Syntrophales bacterium]|nr:hypothetical protein [Syntrophales bacterium]
MLTETPQPNIAFVTSTSYDGNLGGLAGADQKCQVLAEAAGLPANVYKAWLSTSAVDAKGRLGSARGWVRKDGKPFADTVADIVSGKIFYPLRIDENGVDTGAYTYVWTGTDGDGTVYHYSPDPWTCSDWSSSSGTQVAEIGKSSAVAELFTASASISCSTPQRIYCFGTQNNAPVAVTPTVGRIAFVTTQTWIASGGLTGADNLCATEADTAGLSGTYKALLATNGASAASRFNTSGPPWVRPDGVAIAPTAGELFSATLLDSAVNQSADGSQYFGNVGAWTGAENPSTAGAWATTCENWTDSSEPNGYGGKAGFTDEWGFFMASSSRCSADWMHLYCLQY